MTDPYEEQSPCGEVGVHEWARFSCTRRPGHPGEHRNETRKVRWPVGSDGPVTDLQGRPLLKGTVPPSRPYRRQPRSLGFPPASTIEEAT